MDWIGLENTASICILVGSFLVLAMLESWRPLRALTESTERRWGSHGVLFAVSTLVHGLLLRLSPVALAAACADRPWGLLNHGWLPDWLRIGAAIVLLDAVHYFSHRLFHSFHALWRVHEVHHSDRDYDVSTAYRFHPLELLGSDSVYLAAVALLAPPVVAVFVSQVMTMLANALVHANLSLPPAIEGAARWLFITPDLHRLHHSSALEDQNRNYGQTFSVWDRLMGTYREAAASSETGVDGVRHNGALELLGAPFRRRAQ